MCPVIGSIPCAVWIHSKMLGGSRGTEFCLVFLSIFFSFRTFLDNIKKVHSELNFIMAIMKIKMYDLREGLNADKLLPMNTLSGCFLSAMLCSSVDDSALHLAAQGPDHMLLSSSSLPGQPPKPYSLSSALALLTSDLQTESKVTFQKCQLHYIPSYLRDIPETSLPIYYKMQRTSSVFSPPCALATWFFFLFAKNTIY